MLTCTRTLTHNHSHSRSCSYIVTLTHTRTRISTCTPTINLRRLIILMWTRYVNNPRLLHCLTIRTIVLCWVTEKTVASAKNLNLLNILFNILFFTIINIISQLLDVKVQIKLGGSSRRVSCIFYSVILLSELTRDSFIPTHFHWYKDYSSQNRPIVINFNMKEMCSRRFLTFHQGIRVSISIKSNFRSFSFVLSTTIYIPGLRPHTDEVQCQHICKIR